MLCKHEVAGSSPVTSTNLLPNLSPGFVGGRRASSANSETVSRAEAEPGVLITTAAKAPSIGRELVARLIQIARTEKIHTMVPHILSENALMLAQGAPLPFQLSPRRRVRFPHR